MYKTVYARARNAKLPSRSTLPIGKRSKSKNAPDLRTLSYHKMATIIFGPTGHVGSSVAVSAREYNLTNIILAMRDTTKPIPGLTPELESSLLAKRVQVDLSDPTSITSTVSETKAKRAFLYLTPGTRDGMRGAIEALKAGGVEFIVYLSTGSIGSDVERVDPSDVIAYKHAQVERNLAAVFGEGGYVALRPGLFASNTVTWWRSAIPKGEVKLYAGEFSADWIAPRDIGRVAAAVLAGRTVETSVLYLVGPEDMSLRNAVGVIARAAGRDVKIVDVDAEEGIKVFMETGQPRAIAAHIVDFLGKGLESGGARNLLKGVVYDEAVGNVERYTGKPATRFAQWAEENKGEFL